MHAEFLVLVPVTPTGVVVSSSRSRGVGMIAAADATEKDVTERDVTETIVGMERQAFDRWGKGDPSGFVEISAPDISTRSDASTAAKHWHATMRRFAARSRSHVTSSSIRWCSGSETWQY